MSCFQRDNCGETLLCILIIVLMGGFFIWITVDSVQQSLPRDPKFTLVSFTLKDLNVSASSQQVGGNWDTRFQIQSKYFALEYDDLDSSVSYNGEVLSRTNILSFNQHAHNLTLIEAHYSAIDASAGQRDVIVSPVTVSALTAELAHGSVGFDVRVLGKMRSSGLDQQQLKVMCGVVPLIFSEDGASGNFNDGPRKCKVRLHDIPTGDDGSSTVVFMPMPVP